MSVDRWLVNTLPLWLLGLTFVGGLGAMAVVDAQDPSVRQKPASPDDPTDKGVRLAPRFLGAH